MAVNTDIVKAVVSGLVTGGASALTTFLTVFQNLKNRVKYLEDTLGSTTEPRTGLALRIATLEDGLRQLLRDIDSWDDQPPDWVKRFVQRAKLNASSDLSTLVDIESRVDTRLRSFQERLSVLEREGTPDASTVTREEFLEDSRQRAIEMGRLREDIAAVNGLLRGILVALGRDTEPK